MKNLTDHIVSASTEVSEASQSVSDGSSRQASALEEISSTMKIIDAQTQKNAKNALQARDLSSEAEGAASSGHSQMQEMVSAMSEINLASSSISKIIKVIDEMAFQTNLLALNAAVEAARAGKHGKGFAVVAEEVRNLAAKSAQAARETSELIENSIKKVDRGSEIVAKTGASLDGVVAKLNKVATIVKEIAEESNEQANGISQVTQALSDIDRVTQTNTMTSEETAASSKQLSHLAKSLSVMVLSFKLFEGKKS